MTSKARILVVDDDLSNREALLSILEKEGYDVHTQSDAPSALRYIEQKRPDLIISDLRMPDMDGLEFLKKVKKGHSSIEVILLTAYGTVEVAVEAMREGAYDFITKPVKRADLLRTVHKALEKQRLERENIELKKKLAEMESPPVLIGESKAFLRVRSFIEKVAPSTSTVLIEGESGTGKEVAAHAIHAAGPRAHRPFIKLSCASLPESLLEAELFGYEKGAFTGASQRRAGRFEIAHGGTLFLDEITEIPPSVQVKLLRVLQEGEFERLGSNATIKTDVRIIAATNRNIEEAVKKGIFREDLFYRLNVIKLRLPPLRERKEDIEPLATHFLRIYSAKNSKIFRGISKEAIGLLKNYDWPGNVRELENVIERAVVLGNSEVIDTDDLPDHLTGRSAPSDEVIIKLGTSMEEIKKILIKRALEHTGGDKIKAASLLGINPRTIYRKTK